MVRIGPNTVAVFDPAAIPTIYGTANQLEKGEGYMAFVPAAVTTSLIACLAEASIQLARTPLPLSRGLGPPIY